MSEASLYERLGGTYAIAAAADHLVDRLFSNATLNNANPKVNEFHQAQNAPGYKFLVTAWSIEAAGGPACYIGKDMESAHEHLKLSDYEFDVTGHEIKATLFQLGVPEAEINEFMAIIESFRPQVVAG